MSASSQEDPENVFDIIQPLGEGAYGSVYKAMDKRNGALVALKIMPLETESGSLEREVAILKQCKSPYIVNFHGSFEKEGNIWLAMEYCGAGSIQDLIKVTGECMDERQCGVILRESLKGLHYLHSQKLIHRDVKAGNVLVNHKGQCKLADFGVSAQLKDTIDKRKTVIGTPYWMAPEVFKDNKYDYKADVWSLGVTAIEMATGRPPHADVPPLRALFIIPKSDPPNLPTDEDWSDGFRDFISQCCTKNPEDRPTAQQLLRHPWIKQAGSLRVMQELVLKAQPLLDDWRQKQRDQEMAEREPQKPSVVDDLFDGDDQDDYGTMVFQGGDDQYATMVPQGGDDQEDEQQDYGTMVFDPSGDGLGGGYGGYDDSTMVRHEPEPPSKPLPAKRPSRPPTKPLPSDPRGPGKSRQFKSLFDGVAVLDQPFTVPSGASQQDLSQWWRDLMRLQQEDRKTLEKFYEQQIRAIRDRIAELKGSR